VAETKKQHASSNVPIVIIPSRCLRRNSRPRVAGAAVQQGGSKRIEGNENL